MHRLSQVPKHNYWESNKFLTWHKNVKHSKGIIQSENFPNSSQERQGYLIELVSCRLDMHDSVWLHDLCPAHRSELMVGHDKNPACFEIIDLCKILITVECCTYLASTHQLNNCSNTMARPHDIPITQLNTSGEQSTRPSKSLSPVISCLISCVIRWTRDCQYAP